MRVAPFTNFLLAGTVLPMSAPGVPVSLSVSTSPLWLDTSALCCGRRAPEGSGNDVCLSELGPASVRDGLPESLTGDLHAPADAKGLPTPVIVTEGGTGDTLQSEHSQPGSVPPAELPPKQDEPPKPSASRERSCCARLMDTFGDRRVVLLLAILLILYLWYSWLLMAVESLDVIMKQYLTSVQSRIEVATQTTLSSAREALNLTVATSESQLVDLHGAYLDPVATTALFVQLVRAYPRIPWIGIGTASGQLFAAKRASDGTITTDIVFNSSSCYAEYRLDSDGVSFDPVNGFNGCHGTGYDPRVRPWYKDANTTRRAGIIAARLLSNNITFYI